MFVIEWEDWIDASKYFEEYYDWRVIPYKNQTIILSTNWRDDYLIQKLKDKCCENLTFEGENNEKYNVL